MIEKLLKRIEVIGGNDLVLDQRLRGVFETLDKFRFDVDGGRKDGRFGKRRRTSGRRRKTRGRRRRTSGGRRRTSDGSRRRKVEKSVRKLHL